MPAPLLWFPSVLCVPRSKPSPQTLLQNFSGSENQIMTIKKALQARHVYSDYSYAFWPTFSAWTIMEDKIFFPVSAKNTLAVFSQKMCCKRKRLQDCFFSPNVSFLTHCTVMETKPLRCHCLHWWLYLTRLPHTVQFGQEVFVPMTLQLLCAENRSQKYQIERKYQTGLIQTVAL